MNGWFAVVDCARDARLHTLVDRCSNTACLYSGEYDEETRKALPYLVEVKKDEPLAETWRQYEGGKFWGLLCQTERSFAQLRRHFRKFTAQNKLLKCQTVDFGLHGLIYWQVKPAALAKFKP